MGSTLSLPILLLAVVLQTTLVPQVRLWDGGPDLIFLCVLAWSVHAPLEEGVTWALVGGIMQDLMSVAPVGMSSFGLIIVVFTVNNLARRVHGVGVILLLGLTLAGTFFQQMLVWIWLAIWGFRMDLLDDFGFVIVPTIIYNAALILPVYVVLRFVQRRTAVRRVTM